MSGSKESTLETLVEFLADSILPLLPVFDKNSQAAIESSVKSFVEVLGWTLPDPVPPSLVSLKPPIVLLAESNIAFKDLLERARSGDSPTDEEKILVVASVVSALGAVIYKLVQLKDDLPNELPGPYISATQIDNDFVPRLLDYVIIQGCYLHYPLLSRVFRLLGIFEISEKDPDNAKYQPAFTLHKLHLNRIPKFMENPGGIFQEVYGWGTPDLDLEPVFDILQSLSFALNMPGVYDYPGEGLLHAVAPGIDLDNADISRSFELKVLDLELFKVFAGLTEIPKVTPEELQGLALVLYATGGTIELDIPLTETLTFNTALSVDASAGISLAFRPGEQVSVVSDVDGTRIPVTGGSVTAGFSYKSAETDESKQLLSISGGSGLELYDGGIRAGIKVTESQPADIFVEAEVKKARFVLKGGQGDGFLTKIIPPDGFSFDFQILVRYSSIHGFYFEGSGCFEVMLPIHIKIGPIDINNICIRIPVDKDGIPASASATVKAELGPLAIVVENIGVKIDLTFPSGNSGNLGPLDMQLGFKPPNGVGLSIDAEVVKGGGYLFFDTDKGEYGGAIQLVFSDFLDLQAIGLITTKMPDGSDGFALLIMITAEFDPGFQLGMGFALSGVGGLLGLNHSMNLEPLKDGVRDGSLASIMFPSDVVANAPRILSDMRRFFPLQQGKFVIGPMAKISYGSPALLSLSLGIIIEIPGNIAIVGILKAALPTEEKALLLLQINFIGAIEFDKKWAWFFAVIFDSRILTFTLEGEMGFVIGWGSTPVFVVTLGGFHPKFQPPTMPFTIAKRISLSILNNSNAKIQVQAYFAVTSNSVQFGARADLYFGFSACNVSGHLAFEALIQFSPFYFIISISMSVSVAIFGFDCFSVSLAFSLEGPTPWKIKGKGKVKLLFFSVSFDVKKTWGKEEHTSLPPISIYNLIRDELLKKENWRPILPAANSISVSLKEPSQDAPVEEIVLHPAGQLEISQRVAPLGLNLEKFGSQKIEDIQKVVLSNSGGDIVIKGDAKEMFAIGQFLDLKGTEKVTRKSYELQTNGAFFGLSGNEFKTAKVIRRNVRYEEILIDNNFKRIRKKLSEFISKLFAGLLKGAAVSKLGRSEIQKRMRQPFEEKINPNAPVEFTIASVIDNQPYGGHSFASQAEAMQHMSGLLAENPGMQGSIHVIHDYETGSAA